MGRLSVLQVASSAVLLCLALSWAPGQAVTRSPRDAVAETREDRALVYFVRPRNWTGSGRTLFLYADHSFRGALDDNCFTFTYLEPGRHLIWMKPSGVSDIVDLEGGRTYYFEVGFYGGGPGWVSDVGIDLQWISNDRGKSLIEDVKFRCAPTEQEIDTAVRHIRKTYENVRKHAEEELGTLSSQKKRHLIQQQFRVPHNQLTENIEQLGSGATLNLRFDAPNVHMRHFKCLIDGRTIIESNGITNIAKSFQIAPGRHEVEIYLQDNAAGRYKKHTLVVSFQPGSSHDIDVTGGYWGPGQLGLDGVSDPPSHNVFFEEPRPIREHSDRTDREIAEALAGLGSGAFLVLHFETPPGPMKRFKLLVDDILVIDTDGNTDIVETIPIAPGDHELEIILQNGSTGEYEKHEFAGSFQAGNSRMVSVAGGYWHTGTIRVDESVVSPTVARPVLRYSRTQIVAAENARARNTKGHRQSIYSVAFAPDGKRLVTGGEDTTVKLWDVDSGEVALTLAGHNEAITSVAFSPGGDVIASGSRDGTIIVWDPRTAGVVQQLMHDAPVTSMRISPDGSSLASAGLDGRVLVWDLNDGRTIFSKSAPFSSEFPASVEFSPDGRQLAVARWSGIVLWDLSAHERIHKFGRGVQPAVDFSSDGETIAGIVARNHRVLGKKLNLPLEVGFWNAESGKRVLTLLHEEPVSVVAFSPDGKILAAGGDEKVTLWNVETGKPLHVVRMESGQLEYFSDYLKVGQVGSLTFSPDGKILAGGGGKGRIDLCNVETGEVHPLRVPNQTDQ